MSSPIKLFAGSSHPGLALEISRYLHVPVEPLILKRFPSSEVYARPENSVRGCDVFLVQTCTEKVNEDLMEMFIIIDSLKRSFAEKIHIVMPYYGYARQDRVAIPREPISAKVVANLIQAAGADHLITMNVHSDQAQGFFNFPVDNLSAEKFFVDYFRRKKLEDVVVVAPDVGGTKFAKRFADMMGADLAILHKVRPEHSVAEVTAVIGDVAGKTCIIFDDMVDTAGTVVSAKEALLHKGAHPDVYLAAVHGVFSSPAIARLKQAAFKEVVVTNTIPLSTEKAFEGLSVISVAPTLAKTILNVNRAKSVTSSI